MDELVKKLSQGYHPVVANRHEQTAQALEDRIKLGHTHITFTETGTEVGVKLDPKRCEITGGNFAESTGLVHLEGYLTLNYQKVRCIADIELQNLHGSGTLEPVDAEEYVEYNAK